MRICCISDSHGQHSKLKLPDADVLVHAGDITPNGKVLDIVDFLGWFNKQTQFRHRIYIAGNHGFLHEKKPEQIEEMHKLYLTNSGSYYLNETGIEIEGVKFWGSPWTPRFFDWAFNANRGEEIQAHWNKIPKDVNVLITHGPPHGLLDEVSGERHVGCRNLLETLKTLSDLRAHIFGHLHLMGGKSLEIDSVKYVNASVLDEDYNQTQQPVVIEI